jgi:hypothetical protein
MPSFYRVYVACYAYPVFCFDWRERPDFGFRAEKVTFEFAEKDKANAPYGGCLPAFERIIANRRVAIFGVIGQSQVDRTRYRQAVDSRSLDGFDILDSPLILMEWRAELFN